MLLLIFREDSLKVIQCVIKLHLKSIDNSWICFTVLLSVATSRTNAVEQSTAAYKHEQTESEERYNKDESVGSVTNQQANQEQEHEDLVLVLDDTLTNNENWSGRQGSFDIADNQIVVEDDDAQYQRNDLEDNNTQYDEDDSDDGEDGDARYQTGEGEVNNSEDERNEVGEVEDDESVPDACDDKYVCCNSNGEPQYLSGQTDEKCCECKTRNMKYVIYAVFNSFSGNLDL